MSSCCILYASIVITINSSSREYVLWHICTWFIFGGKGGGIVVYSNVEKKTKSYNFLVKTVWGVRRCKTELGRCWINFHTWWNDAMGGNQNTGWTVLSFKSFALPRNERMPQLKVEEVGISRYIFCNPRYWCWRWWYGVFEVRYELLTQIPRLDLSRERVLKRRLHTKKNKNFFY